MSEPTAAELREAAAAAAKAEREAKAAAAAQAKAEREAQKAEKEAEKERAAVEAARRKAELIRSLQSLEGHLAETAERVMPTGPSSYAIADPETGVWSDLTSGEVFQEIIFRMRPWESNEGLKLDPSDRRTMIQDAIDKHCLAAGSIQFGDQAHLVGLPGGRVVDLRDGSIRKSKPEDHLARWHVAAVGPEADPFDQGSPWESKAAEPTEWLALFQRLVPNPEYRQYIAMALGASLWGKAMPGRAHIFLGAPGSGKSLLVEMVGKALGEMAHFDQEGKATLGATGEGHQQKLLHIVERATVVIADELEATGDVSTIKSRLDGSPMTLSPKGGSERTMKPRWAVWGTANDYLKGALDPGVMRRIVYIPTEDIVQSEELWAETAERLNGQLPQLLSWLVRWAIKSGGRMPVIPQSLRVVQSEAAIDADPIKAFVEAHCTASSDLAAGLRTRDIRRALAAVADINTTDKALSSRLAQAGFTSRILNGSRLWHIELSREASQLLGIGNNFRPHF